MLESLQLLANGFATAATPQNLLYCLVGALIGTFVGVLPGLGPIGGIALLIPATFGLDATSALIMLAGIYYGAMYGGSTTSILINVPGETASVITCIEGYKMAQAGRAGPALAIAALGSFIAGTIAIFGLVLVAPPLAQAALAFGPPEFAALMVFAFVVLSNVTGGSLLKALMMVVVGLILGTVGLDPVTGNERFTFDSRLPARWRSSSSRWRSASSASAKSSPTPPSRRDSSSSGVTVPRLRDLYPTLAGPEALDRRDPARHRDRLLHRPHPRPGAGDRDLCLLHGGKATSRSIPRSSATARSRASPARNRRTTPPPSRRSSRSSCIGIPFGPVTAILLGALLIHGVTPGPLLIAEQPAALLGGRREHVHRQLHSAASSTCRSCRCSPTCCACRRRSCCR